MEDGGCLAYFSDRSFEEVKREIKELRDNNLDLGALIKVVTNRTELAKLKIPNAVGAVIQIHAAKLSPYKLISWILESLIKQSGLGLQTSTPVLRLSPSDCTPGNWNVHTARGTISCPDVLFATNAYIGHLLPRLRKLVVPVRAQMSTLIPTESLLQNPPTHTYYSVTKDK